MNESENAHEAQKQPFFLCPICLRKLQKFLRFSIENRYRGLKSYMEEFCQFLGGKSSYPGGQNLSSRSTGAGNKDLYGLQDSGSGNISVKHFESCISWLEAVLMFMNIS